MKAVILAAGTGERLGAGLPKALYSFEGHCLIDHVLASLTPDLFDQILIIGGYQFDLLKKHLTPALGKRIHLIENPYFLKGSIVTLMTARSEIRSEFVLFNSDHLFPIPLLQKAFSQRQGIMAICDRERPLGSDDMKVTWDDNHRLTAISKRLDPYQGGYIGMTYCAEESVTRYWEAAQMVFERSQGSAVVEEVLAELIRLEAAPKVQFVDPFGWIEIDTVEDVASAQERLRRGEIFLELDQHSSYRAKKKETNL